MKIELTELELVYLIKQVGITHDNKAREILTEENITGISALTDIIRNNIESAREFNGYRLYKKLLSLFETKDEISNEYEQLAVVYDESISNFRTTSVYFKSIEEFNSTVDTSIVKFISWIEASKRERTKKSKLYTLESNR